MESTQRAISVVGHGTAHATPDLATAQFTVECLADTVQEAFRASAACLDAVATALRVAGVDGKDLSTTGRSLRAERRWEDGNDVGLRGYVAQGGLSVTLRFLQDAPEALASAIDAGGASLRLNGFSLSVSDTTAAEREARDAAWADALARATQLAASAGVRLGEVLSVQESGDQSPPIAFARAMAVGTPSGIEAGEEAITVSLAVSWAVA
ncbi:MULTISPECIES: SIMPL domain-containing protein [Arthrobacter]|uniref:SIMPL domain-containing protein n=2 Tax=Arthrobacter TaxID=1663 RepID=A0ABU9KM39_9MICC|nr:SIMPL domain-containing protein [Arthrobacter sp. YJM1]MDP5227882.1 SIMPL domain-containing protein [Arthrobacter sp. YJM1]